MLYTANCVATEPYFYRAHKFEVDIFYTGFLAHIVRSTISLEYVVSEAAEAENITLTS